MLGCTFPLPHVKPLQLPAALSTSPLLGIDHCVFCISEPKGKRQCSQGWLEEGLVAAQVAVVELPPQC